MTQVYYMTKQLIKIKVNNSKTCIRQPNWIFIMLLTHNNINNYNNKKYNINN